jgi:bifunctional DNA-binding transcriptional regulator/antitoxin component of YhaV-PrlF toxin-antitoxin module
MDVKVIQLRGKGSLTLPARFRERYRMREGDPITLVDLDGVLLLSPRVGIVARLAGEIERLREEAGLSLDDLQAGLKNERRRSAGESGGGRD